MHLLSNLLQAPQEPNTVIHVPHSTLECPWATCLLKAWLGLTFGGEVTKPIMLLWLLTLVSTNHAMSNSGLGYNVNTIIIHKSRVFKSLSRVRTNSEIAVRKFHRSNSLEDKLTDLPVVLCLVGVGVPVHENLIFAISTGIHKHASIDPSSQGQTSSLLQAMTMHLSWMQQNHTCYHSNFAMGERRRMLPKRKYIQ